MAQPIDDMRRHFRDTCGKFATGITVISVIEDGQVHGMTANAFMSVSLEPPLIAVGIGLQTATARSLQRGNITSFGVSVLAHQQPPQADLFANRAKRRITPVWVLNEGAALMKDSLAWFSCTVDDIILKGDHLLVTGLVLACDYQSGTPLVFYNGRYHRQLEEARSVDYEWFYY